MFKNKPVHQRTESPRVSLGALVGIGFAVVWLIVAAGCDIDVVTTDPLANPYRTDHFIIYCDHPPSVPRYMERVGLRKERLLKHINKYLGSGYDGVIEVFVGGSMPGVVVATSVDQARIRENRSHALYDEGVEVAGMVSSLQWGESYCDYLSRGLEEAARLCSDGSNAMERFLRQGQGYRGADAAEQLAADMFVEITVSDTFFLRVTGTACAGAFVHFLKTRFGAEPIGAWYRSTVRNQDSGTYASTFEDAYGRLLKSVLLSFAEQVTGRSRTRKDGTDE